jgi:DMSO/TMAO reductase YedYZ molybdopterin-dependent catalytic subunit
LTDEYNDATNDEIFIELRGLLGGPVTLRIDDLRTAQRLRIPGQLNCAEGAAPGNVSWEGAALEQMLAQAGVRPDARYVTIGSGEFITAFELDSLKRRNAILADTRNGAPLAREDGGPVRLMFTQGACFEAIKAVEWVELTADASKTTATQIVKARRAAGEHS